MTRAIEIAVMLEMYVSSVHTWGHFKVLADGVYINNVNVVKTTERYTTASALGIITALAARVGTN